MEDIDEILREAEANHKEFVDLINEYWQITTGEVLVTSHMVLVKSLQAKMPNVPEAEWESFVDAIKHERMEAELSSVFMRHVDKETLREVIDLYKNNDALQRFSKCSNVLRKETVEIASNWINYLENLVSSRIHYWHHAGYLAE